MASVATCWKGNEKLSIELVSNNIHSCLPDELLQEILCRLPSSKAALRCKSVCKRWCSLLLSPFFIGRFIADKKRKQLPVSFTLFYGNYLFPSNKYIWRWMTMNLSGTLLNPKNVSPFSLPAGVDKYRTYFTVCASCNDLVLISRTSSKCSRDYYICNTQTNQRLHLPKLAYYDFITCSVTCDPYYHSSYGDEIVIDATYRYSIVVLAYRNCAEIVMKAYLFSNANKNNTGQWMEILLLLPKFVHVLGTPGFIFDGKFHFDCAPYIIGFDPYDEVGNNSSVFNCHLIDCPSKTCSGSRQFQDYGGQLHMFVNYKYNGMQLWCLKDYKTSEWSLLHHIHMQDWIIRIEQTSEWSLHNIRMQDWIMSELSSNVKIISLVGAHPTNPNGIYAILHNWVVLCDLSTRTLEKVSDIKLGIGNVGFPSILPTWPTPLPTLK